MDSRLRQLLAVVAVGIIVRLAVFRGVAVNGDTGLYLYDAKLILWGKRLMVDFPSRSPVFEYALAGVLSLGQSPINSARAFMLVVGIVLGLAIYAFTRTLHSHRTGILAALLFYATPFSVVWGLWVKTEQAAALFVVTAFTLSLWYIDREQIPMFVVAALGTLFGLAFLVRRVVIVHIGAFALFVFWYRYRHHQKASQTLLLSAGVILSASIVLAVVYSMLAGFDLSLALDIANQHAGSLVKSSGQGGIGYVPVDDATAVTAEDRGGWAQLCQKCGRNTVIVGIQIGLLTTPLLAPLLVFFRSYTREAGFWGETVLPVAIAIPAVLGAAQAARAGYYSRTLAAIGLGVAAVLIWRLDIAEWDDLWKPTYLLPVLVLLGLTAGYLYRDRILYVTYFQDFYPYVVALAAIAIVETADRNRDIDFPRLVAVVFVAALLVGTASVNAYPYQPAGIDKGSHWFTVELVEDYGADIEARTDPGDRVVAAQPLYVIETDRRLAADLSRKYYLFAGWPGTPATAAAEEAVISDMDRSQIAIHDHELDRVLNHSDRIRTAFDRRYCPVDSELYNKTGGALYVSTTAGECRP